MILVDTSVWIDWLRRGERPATPTLDRLIGEGEIEMAPVDVQEWLQGAKGPKQLAEWRRYFEPLPMLLARAATYANAGALRRASSTGRAERNRPLAKVPPTCRANWASL